MELLYTYSRPGYSFDIYENRIEIKTGWGILSTRTVIFLRNITSVRLQLRTLLIDTSDNRQYKIKALMSPKEAYQVLMEVL